MNIFKRFIEYKKNLRQQYYEECYHNLVGNREEMINNKCYGTTAEDKYSNYLVYVCTECPYFKQPDKKNKKI